MTDKEEETLDRLDLELAEMEDKLTSTPLTDELRKETIEKIAVILSELKDFI